MCPPNFPELHSPAELAPLIKPAGLYHVKARRLHALLQYLTARVA